MLHRLSGLGLVGLLGCLPFRPSGAPVDIQECDTQCQETYTDCLAGCDGEGACQASCGVKLGECLAECRKRHHPAPAPSAASR